MLHVKNAFSGIEKYKKKKSTVTTFQEQSSSADSTNSSANLRINNKISNSSAHLVQILVTLVLI